MKYKKVKVMADYESTGLWDGDSPGCMIRYGELGLRDGLVLSFREWRKIYEGYRYWEKESRENFDYEGFNKTGLELSQKLKELFKSRGEDVEVFFKPEGVNTEIVTIH